MRSTMSVPGLFAPVRGNGMVLVDGGLRDNYPTGLARELGADIIIGVELSDKDKNYTEINNLGDIIGQGINMLGQDAFERNKDLADVKIKPDLHEYNMLSFDSESVKIIIERGYEAAMVNDALLRDIKNSLPNDKSFQKDRPALNISIRPIKIGSLDISGVDQNEYDYLVKKIGISVGDYVSKNDLDVAVAKIFGTKAFQSVSYDILGNQEPYSVRINCKKGPIHQFGIGLRLDTEDVVSALVNVGLNAHKLQGSTYDFTFKVNTCPYFNFKYSYDSPKAPTFNAATYVRWTDLGNLNFVRDLMNMQYFNWKTDIYISNFKLSRFDARAGIRNNLYNVRALSQTESMTSGYNMMSGVQDWVAVFADGRVDTCDDGYFPNKGVDVTLQYLWHPFSLSETSQSFHTASFKGKFVIPTGELFTIIPSIYIRCLFGSDIPMSYANMAGGILEGRYIEQQLPFVGMNGVAAFDKILGIYRTDFRFKLFKNNFLTASVNYLKDSPEIGKYFQGPGYFGAGLEYAYDSIFGPLSATIHWSNYTKKVGFYLNLGYYF